MRLATIRTAHGTRAVRMDADGAVETGHPDVGTPRYLRDGEVLVTTIAGLGQCRNRCVAEKA